MDKMPLLNTSVNNLSMEETVAEIERLIHAKKSSYVVAVNVDVVMQIENDDYLKKIIEEADLTLTDGKPLIWVSKIYKNPLKEKVSGSDLIPVLCERAALKGYTIFLLGGKEGVAEQAKTNLEKKYDNIEVVGTYSPPYGFEKNEEELKKINEIIKNASPDILVACFGCPKQEKWVYENYVQCGAVVSICAGATVDFLSGNISRAPKWMSDCGLEWFYRFLKEPRRLFKRYFIDDMKIIKLIFKYRNR